MQKLKSDRKILSKKKKSYVSLKVNYFTRLIVEEAIGCFYIFITNKTTGVWLLLFWEKQGKENAAHNW